MGPKSSIVTIADSHFVWAVLLLILSLKRHGVEAGIHVLGVGLSVDEEEYLSQFDGVQVHRADTASRPHPATLKAKALLLAEHDACDYVSLLDGDCVVTGDISPYLVPEGKGLFGRLKTPSEDAMVFARRYGDEDVRGSIPAGVLAQWQADVKENSESRIQNTVCSGNLTISKDFLGFAHRWQAQMDKVLPPTRLSLAHDWSSYAYSQLDESVLNSLLAFSEAAPQIRRGHLDTDKNAYVAHFGPCHPKPWVLWRLSNLKYFDMTVDLIDWAWEHGYSVPEVPWTFKRRNKWVACIVAFSYECLAFIRRFVGKWRGKPFPKKNVQP